MFGLSTVAIRWIGGALLVFATIFGIYYKGRLDEREIFNRYKAEVKAAAAAQEAKTEQVIIQQERITKKAEERYAKDLASIRNTYQRLRGTTSSSSMSTAPDPATDPSQATAYYLDVAPELATQCGETTQQLVSLQEWIADQSQVAQ